MDYHISELRKDTSSEEYIAKKTVHSECPSAERLAKIFGKKKKKKRKKGER